MTTRAFVSGCAGPRLTVDEIAFFRDADPWGLILFRRNVETPEQVLALTASFREAVGRADAPVLVDQEGGRVQRLGPPHWPAYPSARTLASLPVNNPLVRREAVRLASRLMAHDLRAVGITIDCAPVLDVPLPDAHAVIGDRAYAGEPDAVAVYGRAAAEGLLAGGVLPVIKHMPGHGRAKADSHLALPVVDASWDDLLARDIAPFATLSDMPAAMTAHVVYTAIDHKAPGTTSRTVFRRVIRGEIGYDGLVFSDDLSMQALSGSLSDRAGAAIAAGVDIALHCNGKLDEMVAVAGAVPDLRGAARRRARAAMARIAHRPEPLDPVDARGLLEAMLAATG
ncbi:beta-N-acetylhexosaminidase [uncultured Alsobacter sp.]|uniref:beta-N-acetylhexosaminidase n=1 Tax=uncultured Alsobacter sp. TaxID=1748258 RepID=UPI0025D07628|nr:beta-N-acetylhexosaminidase [uncultured Alsobacter sp.]